MGESTCRASLGPRLMEMAVVLSCRVARCSRFSRLLSRSFTRSFARSLSLVGAFDAGVVVGIDGVDDWFYGVEGGSEKI
ncbi:hypothetical protein DL98DRAFT_513527 [Cadophora sp. DSE1049]|nr:hypothetical protein DL98DRAFT_513527 [Cadophora sp. DSE1049]